jgi:hypothetical protein
MSVSAIASALLPQITEIVSKGLDSKVDAEKLSKELAEVASSVVVAEAQGEGWLQRSWRPLVMLWFSILIGFYWFGFVPTNMPVSAVNDLFDLVQLGLGGYVIGRSGEKIAKTIAPALKR